MNAAQERKLTQILAAGLLLAGLGLVVLSAGLGRSVNWNPPLPAQQLPAQAASKAAPAVPSLTQFATIWSRPLLNPDRRPVQYRSDSTRLGDFELTGVILTPGLKLAMLQPRPAPGSAISREAPSGIRVALGSRIPDGSWQLVRLEPRQAWFAGQGRQLVLELIPAVAATAAVRTEVAPAPAPAGIPLEQQRREALQQILQRMQQARPSPAPAATGP